MSNGRKFGSYVNSGLIMQCFKNVIDEIDYYNIFILFGIFIFFMTGAILFNFMAKYAKTTGEKILALIFCLLCILGYPFNSLLFGFEYLSMGLLVIRNYISNGILL